MSAGLQGLQARWRYVSQWVAFTAHLVGMATVPAAYNHAVREVLIRQVYFTAWEVLASAVVFTSGLTLLLAHIVAQVAQPFGLQAAAGELVLRLVVLEVVPLGVAVFLALRTGAAMNAEVALMNQRQEAASWLRLGLDPARLEYLPRLVGGVVSTLALTLVTVVASLAALHVSVILSPAWQLSSGDWWALLARGLDALAWFGLVFKALAFGLILTSLPLYEGSRTPAQPHMVPVSVLRGMVRVFVGLSVVWLGWLVVRYV